MDEQQIVHGLEEQQAFLGLASLLVLGIASQWVAWRLKLPSILLLLLCGILAGPVTGLVRPDAFFGELLTPVVSFCVALILFEGSLSLRVAELLRVGRAVRNLISIGALVTWVCASLAAWLLLDLGPALAVLLGAVLTVTGPTVIGPMLRHVRPQGSVGAVLKWESILIDPIGATLAVLVFEAVVAGGFGRAATAVAGGLANTVLLGGAIGAVGALTLVLLLKRYWIPDFLHSPVSFMAVIAVFAISNAKQSESGLLAVTVMGLILANQRWVSVAHIVEFKENLRVLLLSFVFVLLSARLEPDKLREAAGPSLMLLAVLVLAIRPLAVVLSTSNARLSWKERAFLACMAPRGIVAAGVASVFALRLSETAKLSAEVQDGARMLVPVVFIVIIGAAAIYGLAALPLARLLGLAQAHPRGAVIVGAHQWGRELGKALSAHGCPVLMVDTNPANVDAARMAGLRTYSRSILSDKVLDDVDLGGIGRLLALTSNDELNTLAAQRFANVFGRSEVYQLATKDDTRPDGRDDRPHRPGRLLFGPDVTFATIEAAFEEGARIEACQLSAELDMRGWRERHGPRSVPLFLLSKRGRVAAFTASQSAVAQSGDTVIGMVRGTVATAAQAAAAAPAGPAGPAAGSPPASA